MEGTIALMNVEDGELHGSPAEQRQQIDDLVNFGMHHYYSQISDFMFPTVFVDVTREEASAWRLNNISAHMDENQISNFNKLKEKVKSAISQIRSLPENKNANIFVKLSSRSPKDAVWQDKERIIPILKENLSHVKKNDLNGQMIALRRSFLKASAVKSAEEAFNLMSWSSRIVSDLKIFLTASENSEWFDIKIVVRQFMNDLDISNEFRGFIKNGKLTALSQYQTECYFPEIHKRKDKIAALVQKFVSETLVNKLPEWAKEGSVADFAIIGEKVYVVELNPFATTSGACLFKWENDKAILYGDAPFEIRVVEKVVDHLEACFAPWSELMKEAEKKKGKHSWLKKKK